MFQKSHLEKLPSHFARYFKKSGELKIDLWNAFMDSDLIGICDDDCSAIPRILPASYLPTIKQTSKEILLFLMKLLSLPKKELLAILPPTPVTDYLINELALLKHRPRRLTGSLRYDMAIVGKPRPSNPPKLFEVNEIGFDGTGRSSYIQETLLRLIPELKGKVLCLDTAANEIKNMRRLGKNIVRFQCDHYNWEEEVLLMKAKRHGLSIRLISPTAFDVDIDEEYTKLTREKIHLKNNRLTIGKNKWRPDAFQISDSFELKDYMEAPKLYRDLIRTSTPHYSPFFTALIAPKTILPLISDNSLVQRLVGSRIAKSLKRSILPAYLLDGHTAAVQRNANNLVIKHADGMGGEKDYIGKEMRPILKRIRKSERNHWAVQKRIHMNSMKVDGILSRPRRVIADLGVYLNYDWNGRKFTHLTVGGFITRATNRSLKVNVSGGGIQVPVMFDRSK